MLKAGLLPVVVTALNNYQIIFNDLSDRVKEN